MNTFFSIAKLKFPHRLIQGPLAGYSCAPMRMMFADFMNPAYCISEMISAVDVLAKHQDNSRYIYRSPYEAKLAYQLAGSDPLIMATAALKLQDLGADLIDINCGCPMPKIRKKGAGSALLEKPAQLFQIIETIKQAIEIPLSVKIRIQDEATDSELVKGIESSGADALIVHGRRYTDDYDVPCDFKAINKIKSCVSIPVIANGDIGCVDSLARAINESGADAYMISRAGCGKPWLYEDLLLGRKRDLSYKLQSSLLKKHLIALEDIEGEYQACLQGRSLIRYYLRPFLHELNLEEINRAIDMKTFLGYF